MGEVYHNPYLAVISRNNGSVLAETRYVPIDIREGALYDAEVLDGTILAVGEGNGEFLVMEYDMQAKVSSKLRWRYMEFDKLIEVFPHDAYAIVIGDTYGKSRRHHYPGYQIAKIRW